MWLIPLLLIGVALYATGRERGASAAPSPQRALPPGPIAVLGELVRIGHAPPPQVILCAIAEAESIGRCDLATDIIRVFVAPIVYAQQPHLAPSGHPPGDLRWRERAHLAPGRGPVLIDIDRRGVVQERVYAPSFRVPKRQDAPSMSYGRGSCDRPPSPQRSPRVTTPDPSLAQQQVPVRPGSPSSLTDEQIRAALDADPERFIRDVAAHAHDLMNDPNWSTNPATAHLANRPVTADEVMSTIAMAAMTDAAHGAQQPPEHPIADTADHSPNSQPDLDVQPVGYPIHDEWDEADPPMTASPLLGISNDAWSHFCGKLVREAPTYQSARHVGQYRQRRERLTELGIDPDSIVGSAEMQRAALDADLADAYHHAADETSGLVRNVNRKIMLPNQGDPMTITLSGVLGVIQAAGLEGAVGWLESPRDRKKYPHTTQAFVRCNGVF